MGDIKKKLDGAMDNMENKMHEMKGQAKQKQKDMKKDDQTDITYAA